MLRLAIAAPSWRYLRINTFGNIWSSSDTRAQAGVAWRFYSVISGSLPNSFSHKNILQRFHVRASNILILDLFLIDPKLCCRYVFPSIRLSKHNFPIQLSPRPDSVGAKPDSSGRFFILPLSVGFKVRDHWRVIDTLVSFHQAHQASQLCLSDAG